MRPVIFLHIQFFFYYSFGIIKVERDSRGILPGKFAEDKSDTYFNFINGFSLGEEEIIDFSD